MQAWIPTWDLCGVSWEARSDNPDWKSAVFQLKLQVTQLTLRVLTPPWFPRSLWYLILLSLQWDFMKVSSASEPLAPSSSLWNLFLQSRVSHLLQQVSLGRFYRAQLEENEQKIILNLWIFTLSTATPCSSWDSHIYSVVKSMASETGSNLLFYKQPLYNLSRHLNI